MKKRWIIASMALIAGASVEAALIEVKLDNPRSATAANVKITGADQSGTEVASVDFTNPSGGEDGKADAVRTKAYTITGIDFDGDTIADDLTWTFRSDGEVQGLNAAGEGATFDLSVAGSIVNSRLGYTSVVTFKGFSEIQTNAQNGDLYGLGTAGVGSTDIGTGLEGNTALLTNPEQFSIAREAGGFSASNVSYAFDVSTTIPEPATLGLIAASGASLLFIRRCLQL